MMSKSMSFDPILRKPRCSISDTDALYLGRVTFTWQLTYPAKAQHPKDTQTAAQIPALHLPLEYFTVSLHNPNDRQFACR